MLDIRATTLGDFDFTTRTLDPDEKKYYGIFISHSSADNDEHLYPLRDAMLARGMHPLCDRDFLSGGDDFQLRIEKTLDCYAAVIILTRSSLRSHWVNYEMGILSGRDIPIYIYDPEGLFSLESKGKDPTVDAFYESHIGRYLPAYADREALLLALSDASPYADMFCEENDRLTCATFRRRMAERAETVIATLESDIFDTHYEEFAACKIGILVPNFGMFHPNHGDGEHCYARRCAPLADKICPYSKSSCALCAATELTEENKECTVLNAILYNATLYRKNDFDRRGNRIERGCVEFHVPLHRLYGTEFKFILDVADNQLYPKLMQILEKAGMNPTSSNSMIGGRIYLSLPERRAQGLFRLEHEFTNNFLCAYAARGAH